jgi:hypothetical protein
MPSDWPAPDTVLPFVEEILEDHPRGLSEYELLTRLGKKIPYFTKPDVNNHSLDLFRRHFLLFHCLYLLQLQYEAEQSGILSISALKIRLQPYQDENQNSQDSTSISTPDPVRDYYLDIGQLQSTDKSEIDELLGKFWLALARHDARAEALALLGLNDPVDDETIRRRYRHQVMLHHPDRGGDTEKVQQLNAAISDLLPKTR